MDKYYTQHTIYNIAHEVDTTPKNYTAAMSCPQSAEWRKAIDIELDALETLKTWEVVDIPTKCSLKTGALVLLYLKKKLISFDPSSLQKKIDIFQPPL